MEDATAGGMTYPCTTHVSHEVGFNFHEITIPLLNHAFDVAEAVYPGLKKILNTYVEFFPFPHNLTLSEGVLKPSTGAHEDICSLFHQLSVLMIESERSNACTAECLKTISKEKVRNIINTECSSSLYLDQRDIGGGPELLRGSIAQKAGIENVH
eukprot:9274083-Ditylum_brightwellii.AAC.1